MTSSEFGLLQSYQPGPWVCDSSGLHLSFPVRGNGEMNQGFSSLSSTLTVHKAQTTKGFSVYLKKTHVEAKPNLNGLGPGQDLYKSHLLNTHTSHYINIQRFDWRWVGPVPTESPFKAPKF